MKRGYFVDAATRTIAPIDYTYKTLRSYLPGGICIAQIFENGDVLYVDDEALLRPATVAFRIRCRADGQPMMSNAILTGPDSRETTLPPGFRPADLEREIEWLSLDQALDWFRARASEPAVIETFKDVRIVHAVWGDLLRNLEGQPDGYDPERIFRAAWQGK